MEHTSILELFRKHIREDASALAAIGEILAGEASLAGAHASLAVQPNTRSRRLEVVDHDGTGRRQPCTPVAPHRGRIDAGTACQEGDHEHERDRSGRQRNEFDSIHENSLMPGSDPGSWRGKG